jgi:chemotaxis protein CheC
MDAISAELDMYNELTNVGAGNAATALSQMINSQVDIGLPQSAELTLDEVDHLLGTEDEIAIVLVGVEGDLEGNLCLALADYQRLADALGVPEEFVESALAEVGNIIAARFLIAITQMTSVDGEVRPPAVGFAPREAALDTVVALAAGSEPFFVLRMALFIDHEPAAELLYFPAEHAISRMRTLL